jgi:hypothetical protein
MNARTIKFKRIEGLNFGDDHNSNALDLSVYFDKGGTNWGSGREEPGGYWVNVHPVHLAEDGTVSFMMFTGLGRKFLAAKAPRFNAPKLRQLAEALLPHKETITALILAGNYEGIKALIDQAAAGVFPVKAAAA